MLCHESYECVEDCITYVHSTKHQFVHDQGLCACAEDYFMYDHARKHHSVCDRSPESCVEGSRLMAKHEQTLNTTLHM